MRSHVLRDAQLIRATRSGRNIWYEIAAGALLETQAWLDGLVDRWSRAPTTQPPLTPTRLEPR